MQPSLSSIGTLFSMSVGWVGSFATSVVPVAAVGPAPAATLVPAAVAAPVAAAGPSNKCYIMYEGDLDFPD